MRNRLKSIKTPYVDAQTLLNLLVGYKRPRECIARMVKNGELIRLKNGFFLIADRMHETHSVVPHEQIANLLYGPSYVSLEWALSFYGMIPERVHTITSMTLGRAKEFQTPVGHFVYHPLSSQRYSIGITQKETPGEMGGFLIATPEKALADLVFITCRKLSKAQLRQELLESKRIDETSLRQLNKDLLIAIEKSYRATSVTHLIDLIGVI